MSYGRPIVIPLHVLSLYKNEKMMRPTSEEEGVITSIELEKCAYIPTLKYLGTTKKTTKA